MNEITERLWKYSILLSNISTYRYTTLMAKELKDNTSGLNRREIVLSSRSPRRRSIIQLLDISTKLFDPEDQEDAPEELECPQTYVNRISLRKAQQAISIFPDAVIIGVDTTVTLDNTIFRKPKTPAHALSMLETLKHRTHNVITGITTIDARLNRVLTSSTTTKVTMRKYSSQEMSAYISSGDTFDKAGGYAIQDDIFNPVKEFRGCYLNVVGLPICTLTNMLKILGIKTGFSDVKLRYHSCLSCIPSTVLESSL